MITQEEIVEALHQLPAQERWSVLAHFSDELWTDWDQQIERDLQSGQLDSLLETARSQIRAGAVHPLHEILRDR